MTFLNGEPSPQTDISTIAKSGENAFVKGAVHNIRNMGEFAFIILRTANNVIQCVYSPEFSQFNIAEVKEGDWIEITGCVSTDERAANGFEIRIKTVKVLSSAAEEFPFAINKKILNLNIDTNLNYRPLTLRNPAQRAIFRIQEGIAKGFSEFMSSQGFTEIHTPKIAGAGAEGGANIFKLDYFGTKAYLAQSPQLYKQTMVGVFERVFEIAPVYRAEKHSTSRHLNEYIGLDFEMGFIDSMVDVMQMETAMLRNVIKVLKTEYDYELKLLKADLPEIMDIPCITFAEARDIIISYGNKAGKWDLEPEDEVTLCKYAKEKYGSEFIFVTHYPTAKRPFYAMEDPADERFTLSFDLLFRGLEVTSGGQRIHDYNMQVEKMKRMGIDPADFESYLMIFKYGMPPHGGLGLGLERLTMKLLNLKNIRETSLFPRDINRLEP
jgi:nondiscriminating aspartyl-tRNA synthetase